MSLSEMTKNDMAAVEHILQGCPDSICGKCGVRVDPNRCIWSTCTPVDKMYTCMLCAKVEKGKRCPSCERTTSRDGLCLDCESYRCPRHSMVSPGALNQDFGMWPVYKKEIPRCVDCAYWRQYNPKDYLARIEGITEDRPELIELKEKLRKYRNRFLGFEFIIDKPGINTRYVGPIVDRKICQYCKEMDDGRHSPVFLLFRGGTRFQFCNPYRKDYKRCFEKWIQENDMRCQVRYKNMRCRGLKSHPEGKKKGHEFYVEGKRWIMTDLDMNIIHQWNAGNDEV